MRFTGESSWPSSAESALPRASSETRPLLSVLPNRARTHFFVDAAAEAFPAAMRAPNSVDNQSLRRILSFSRFAFSCRYRQARSHEERARPRAKAPRSAHSCRFLVVDRVTSAGIQALFSICTVAGLFGRGGPFHLQLETLSPGFIVAQARQPSIFKLASRACTRSIVVKPSR